MEVGVQSVMKEQARRQEDYLVRQTSGTSKLSWPDQTWEHCPLYYRPDELRREIQRCASCGGSEDPTTRQSLSLDFANRIGRHKSGVLRTRAANAAYQLACFSEPLALERSDISTLSPSSLVLNHLSARAKDEPVFNIDHPQ